MCGMFFTFDENIIPRLSEENSRRGGVKESLTKISIYKNDSLNGELLHGFVGHFQAPTSSDSRSHPHKLEHSSIWHNGIVKEDYIKVLQKTFETDEKWDTALLHHAVLDDFDLGEIDGSFALMLYYNDYIFKDFSFCRNALAPLYINRDKCIVSSVKIKDLGVTELISEGIWYTIKDNTIVEDDTFNIFVTKNNPYDF